MALSGQRPPDHLPVDHIQVAADIESLHHASKKKEEVNIISYYYYYYYFRNFLHGFRFPFSKS